MNYFLTKKEIKPYVIMPINNSYKPTIYQALNLLFFLCFSFFSFAQPGNDDCTGAKNIVAAKSCITTIGDLTGATLTKPTPANFNKNDVWYSFVANTPIHYINLIGDDKSFQAGIEIYKGNCGSGTFTLLGTSVTPAISSNFTSTTNGMSATVYGLTPTQTYYYRVFHNGSTTVDTLTFSTCVENYITNNECINADTLDVGKPGEACSSIEGRIQGATLSTSACVSSYTNDVWFKFKATESKHFITVTGATDFNPIIQFYPGDCNSTPLACENKNNSKGSSEMISPTNLIKDKWYYIRIYSPIATSTPYFNICVTTPPSNDECDGAIELKPGLTCDGTFSDGTYASKSLIPNTNLFGDPNDDVWFKFKADTTLAFISVSGSATYDAVVEVFKGCDAATANAVAKPTNSIFVNDASYIVNQFGNAVVTGLTKGSTYYYRVYDKGSVNSDYSFSTCVVNPVINDDCSKAIKMGSSYTCKMVDGDGTYASPSSFAATAYANDDVWYKFDALSSNCAISINASLNYTPIVEIFASCNNATPIKTINTLSQGCQDNAGIIKLNGLTPNTTYYYRIYNIYDNKNTDVTKPATFTFSSCVTLAPINDNCGTNAKVVYPDDKCNSIVGDATYATASSFNACEASGDAGDDLWFTFTAQGPTQFINVKAYDYQYDPVVQLFSKNCISLGNNYCNDKSYITKSSDNIVAFTGLQKNTEYMYRVYDHTAINPDTMRFETCVVNPVTNDDCSGALPVAVNKTCTSISGDGTYATPAFTLPNNTTNGTPNDDVWFSFVATKTDLSLSIEPNGKKYNPVVQVFASNCPTAYSTAIKTEDTSFPKGGFGTLKLSNLQVGTTYYYCVYDFDATNKDTMSFNTCIVENVANDDCKGAIDVIAASTFSPTNGDGTYATLSMDACGSTKTTANDDVWFRFKANGTNEFITVIPSNPNYTPIVQVFKDCPNTPTLPTPLTPGNCISTYPKGSFGTSLITGLTKDVYYYYRVFDVGTTNSGKMTFTTGVVDPVINDECKNAKQVIAGATCNSIEGDGTYASESLPGCKGNANDDVWFKFTPSANTQVIYIEGSKDFDPVIQLFSGCGATPSTPIEVVGNCNDVRFPKGGLGSYSISGLNTSQTYYYRVYDFNSSTPSPMTFNTCITNPPTPPINDEPCNAIEVKPTNTCTYTTFTTEAATATSGTGIPAPGCNSYLGSDVWFKVKVPFSGELTVSTKDLVIKGAGLALYSGNCSNLKLIKCAEGKTTMPSINQKGLIPGEFIWLRIWEFDNDNNGTFGLCITKPAEAPLVSACSNQDFESDLNSWFGTTGVLLAGATGAPAPLYSPNLFNTTSPTSCFQIMTGGIDPVGGFKTVYKGAKSIRLGNKAKGGTGYTLEQYFPVTKENASYTYNYAAVLQSGGHPTQEQPFFKVELFDDDGQQIGCGDYLVAAPKTGVGDNIGFLKSPKDPLVIYKTWTTININLTPYIGKNIHVRYTVGGCSHLQHYGYVYLDCECKPFEISADRDIQIKPSRYCVGDTVRLYAPKGALSYSWKNEANVEVSNTDSLVYKTTLSGNPKFNCDVTMFGTSLCPASIPIQLEIASTPTLTITDPVAVCPDSTIDLTNVKIVAGSTANLKYTFYSDNSYTTKIADPTKISTAGTYYIQGEKSVSCLDKKEIKVSFKPLPEAVIANNPEVCKNATNPELTFTGSKGKAPYTFTYDIDGTTNKTIQTISGNSINIAVPTLTTGIFKYNLLKVKDANGCSQDQTGTSTVKINDIITQSITCGTKTTNSVQFKWNDNSAATSYTYVYTTNKGQTGSGTLSAGSLQTTVVGLTLNEKVDIQITPVGDPCGKVFTGSCTSLNCNSPIVDSKTPIIQCNNTTINAITYTSTPSGGKIKWTNGLIPSIKIGQKDSATGVFPSFTALNTTYAPILDTIYITATDISCTGPATEHYITINPDAHVIDPTDVSVCSGDKTNDIHFSTNNTGGTTTYSWKNDKSSIGLPATGNGDIIGFKTTNTSSSPIIATIEVTPHFTNAGITCDGPSKSFTITVNPLPNIQAGNDTSICKQKSLKLRASGGVSYQWVHNITDNQVFTPTETTKYLVIGTDANGCINKDSLIVTVNELPKVNAGKDTSICAGEKVTLKASGANSYVWDNGITDNIMFSPTKKMTYTVIGTDVNGCANTDSVDVSIYSLPIVNAGDDQAICIGKSTSLKASGALTFTWNNGIVDGENFTPNSNQSYVVKGTDVFGCKNTDTVVIIVNNLPQVWAGNDTTVCQGYEIQVKGQGALTYTWNNGISDRVNFKANSNQQYLVVGTDSNGCVNKDSMLVAVNNAPNVLAGNDTTICKGKSITLHAKGNAISFSWDQGVIDNTSFQPNKTTKYVLTGKDAINCTNTDTILVTIHDLPIINAGNDTSICIGQSLTLAASGGQTYSWDNGVINLIQFTPNQTTMYHVVGTDNFGCVNKDSLNITINQLPNVHAGNDTTVCEGSNLQLKGTGASSYKWNNGISDRTDFKALTDNKFIVIGTDIHGCINKDSMLLHVNKAPTVEAGKDSAICIGQSITLVAKGNALTYSWDQNITDGVEFTPFSTKKYILAGEDAIHCKATDTITIIVHNLPSVNAGKDTSICIGKSAILKAIGAQTYTWDNGITDKTPFIPTTSKQYVVTGIDVHGCTNKDSLFVNIDQLPTIQAGNDTAICSGSTIQLSGKGGISYVWNHTVLDKQSFTPSTTEKYIVIGTDSHGCINKDSIVVTVNTLPSITMKEVCETREVNVTSNHIPATTSPWISSETAIATIDKDGKVTGIKNGQSTITFIDNNGCKDSKILTVHPTPIILNEPLSLCAKSKIILKSNHVASTTNPWSSSNNNVLLNNNSGETMGITAGNSSITFTDTKGCQTTKNLTLYPLPIVDFKSEKIICIDDSIYMKDLSSPTSANATWSYGDGTRTKLASHKFQKSGLFSISLLSITSNGCKDSITKINYVEVVPKPTVTFTFTPDSIDIFNPEIFFTNNSNAKHYKWIFGDEKPISVANNPTHIFPSTTGQHYIVTLTGYNTDNGCTTSYKQEIVSKEPLIYYIPNTFTPNGDEVNNTFKPIFYSGLDIYNYHLSIYNRWGELIFESNNSDYGWDGTYGNQIVESATYIWKLEFKEKLVDKRHSRTGHVNVIR